MNAHRRPRKHKKIRRSRVTRNQRIILAHLFTFSRRRSADPTRGSGRRPGRRSSSCRSSACRG